MHSDAAPCITYSENISTICMRFGYLEVQNTVTIAETPFCSVVHNYVLKCNIYMHKRIK